MAHGELNHPLVNPNRGFGPRRNAKVDWKRVDFSKFGVDLARELGVSEASVSFARKRYAPETMRRDKRDATWVKDADWTLPTRVLAKIHGKKPATVSFMRKIHAPETLYLHGPGRPRKDEGLPS